MKLTHRQRQVLEFIQTHILEKGFPPTIREICDYFGFASPLSAKQHVDALEKKGYITKSPSKQRSIEVCGARAAQSMSFPLLGKIRAGKPVLAIEEIEEHITVDSNIFRIKNGFALRIVGNSMIDAGILEGDIALVDPVKSVKNGDIVVALLGDEATIKRFFKKDRVITLAPENKEMEPITVKPSDIHVLGRLKGIMRKIY